MKAVNEGSGLHFLEDFLSFVHEEDVWNFTLLELVEWKRQQQEIRWESKKTLTGGDITFQNIPQGLAVAVRLPHHYSLKDIPPGVEVTTHADSDTQIFDIVFLEDYADITLSFRLTYESPVYNEVLILHQLQDPDYSKDLNTLQTFLASWEIQSRSAHISCLSCNLLNHPSMILVDKNFLKRSLTLKEKILLSIP